MRNMIPGAAAEPGHLPPLSREDVDDARRRLAGRVVRTPVVRNADLDRLAGVPLWLKAENMQRGGSYKMRGALLAVDRLARSGSRGVVAQSTGNHAIAVALAALDHKLPAVLVLPADIAENKVIRIRQSGAEVVLAGVSLAERLAVMEEVRAARGYDVVDSFECPDVVAGQGTATAELIEQAEAAGGRLSAVVVPVGGGSGVAGACLAVQGRDVLVVGAEPAAVPSLSQALRAGRPVTVRAGTTIADGLRPETIGRLPFRLCQDSVSGVQTVGEASIAQATCLALTQAKLLVEPAAATALAAALHLGGAAGRGGGQADGVGVLLTGGNIEARLISELLAGYVDPIRRAAAPAPGRA